MSYTNFAPNVWAETIERELERVQVFAEDCNRECEGVVKEKGDSVKILGVGKPTIHIKNEKNRNDDIPSAEEIETTSIHMPINQLAVFNYYVGDIDKKQAVKGLMGALRAETSEELGNAQDKHIASMALEAEAVNYNSSVTKVEAANVLAQIDGAQQKLWENDVSQNTELVMTVSPRFYMLIRSKLTSLDTDNSGRIVKGKVGRYGGILVKMSNNVATSGNGANDHIMLRTRRAIAFVRPMIHIEPYRPEKKFGDAIKGFVLYQAKIVRPKEMIVLNVKYS
jgi:hypothetical protein